LRSSSWSRLSSRSPDGVGVVLCCLLAACPAFAQMPSSQANAAPVSSYSALPAGSTSADDRTPDALPDAPSASIPTSPRPYDLSFQERVRVYRHSILSPYTVIGPAFGAGIGQWEDQPPEWGQGGVGYARRFGSGMARHLIAETIRFSVAAMDGEDPRYHPSLEKGVWNRAFYAVEETVTSHTASGGRIPAFSRFAGIYGAAFFSNSWYPDSHASVTSALKRGSTAMGSSIGFHLFQEFFPREKLKALHIAPKTD
jgi:hypothetical protein